MNGTLEQKKEGKQYLIRGEKEGNNEYEDKEEGVHLAKSHQYWLHRDTCNDGTGED